MKEVLYGMGGCHEFDIRFEGVYSHVLMDGVQLKGVRDAKVHQPLEGPTIVTIEFLAGSVNADKKREHD